MRQKLQFVLLVLLALALIVVMAASSFRRDARVETEAPEISLPMLPEMQETTLSSMRGQVVLLDFFATWCPPCREELPVLNSLWVKYQDKGLVIVGINKIEQEQSGVSGVTRFLGRFGIAFPILLDTNDQASRLYNVRSIPTLFLIDRQGKIQAVFQGARSEAELEAAITPLL